MRTLPLSLFISLILLATHTSLGLAYNQIKDFGQIVVTSQEILNLDLNEYFTGKIDSFGVEPPLRIPDKFELVNHQDKAYTTEEDIIIINSPKDNFGNWDLTQDWIFMDKANQLHFCEQSGSSDAPTLSCIEPDGPFYGDDEIDEKNCLYMHRIDRKILTISCSPNKENGYVRYFFYDVEDKRVVSDFYEKVRGNRTRTLQVYSTYPKTILLTYPKPEEGSTVGSVIALHDISNLEEVHLIKTISGTYFSVQDFVIQRVIPIGGRTIYFAETSGTVFRADTPEAEKPGANNTFTIIDGNILEMTAAFQTNHGQASTIVAIHSPKYVYYIDWTIANNPLPVNKYPLSPIGEAVKKVRSLEVSQDFVSTIVSTAKKACTILVYYLGPSLPGDVYYRGDCPENTALMKTQRSGNSIFFVSNLQNTLDFHFYQIFPSILRINSTKVGKFTTPLSINGEFHENLEITVIKPDDYSVYLASPGYQSTFGLVVPGKSSFEITSLLNGPFLTYTSNETDFTVVDPLVNISFTTTSKSDNNNIFAYYPDATGDTVKWYSKYDGNHSIVVQTCTRTAQKYKCTAKEPFDEDADEFFRLAVSDQYFFAATEEKIQIYDQALKKKKGEFNLPDGQANDDDLLRCEQLLASQSPLVPFLYCVGSNGAYIYRTDDLTQEDGFKLNIECDDYKNATMALNYKNPAILFISCEKTIYFVDVFSWAMHDESPMISTIEVKDPKHYGYSFGVSSKSLLLLLKESGNLLEYDITTPRRPTLIKTHESVDFEHTQILSDSRNSDNIYILGVFKQNTNPVAIVYRSQYPGTSNFLTAINLPNSRFDPAVPKIYPMYPAIRTADNEEIYLIPIGTQFGWTVRTKVQVNFANQNQSDPTAIDYEKKVGILFTGKHAGMKPSFSIAQASLHLILTDETVRATKNLIYTGVKLAEKNNSVLIDPRNVFNGTIKSYNVIPEDETEEKKVGVIQQVQDGELIKLGATDVYSIIMAGSTFIVQKKTAIVTIGEDGVSKENPITYANALSCDAIIYNTELEQTLTTCLDTKNSRYVFAFFTLTGSEAVGPVIVDTKDAGKTVASIQKVIFTVNAIYVLENIGSAGSFVHVFLYNASETTKSKVQYATSVASSDLNIAYLSIADMAINFKGSHDQYRLFLIDDDFGLRTIDIQIDLTFKTVSPFNPRSFPLGGPSNAYWNRIHTVSEEGDLSSAIELVLASPNFKTYYLKYYANSQQADALKILRVFVPLPNTYFTRVCYADRNTFLFSASNGTQDFALLYSISNLTSKANSQNFPLLGREYTPPVSGLCSFTFDPVPEKRHFYLHSGKDIANYTVSPNITLLIEGIVTSKYITIEAVNELHKDSFQFYLIPPPQDGINPVFLWFVIGGVSVLVIIVLFCYFNIKSKKLNLYDYSLVSEDASAFQNEKV